MKQEEMDLQHIRAVKARHEHALLRKANVVSVGIGFSAHHAPQAQFILIVNVTHKVTWDELEPDDRIPREIEGIPVSIEAIGKLRAHQHHDEEEAD